MGDTVVRYLREKKEQVDRFLLNYFQNSSDSSPLLKKAILYSLEAGGKRIRPILAIAAAEAVGGKLETVLPVASAFEMIHTFSLIHDDLPSMDNDDLRRGKPTNHKVFGEGLAILAGDGLLCEAFSLLSSLKTSSQISSEVLVEVIREIAWATGPRGMVGGQVLDLEAQGVSLDKQALEKIHHYKTGRLIQASVTVGAKVGGAKPPQLEALRNYGEKIGLAFQIADDILNVEGTKEELGKSIGSDDHNKKATYPAILGLETSKQLAKELVDQSLAALKNFDAKADPLREIAQYIVLRKN
ncbi:MAG: polyprenyl synthetase [Deltaproteobacteria bacterium RIFCSPLOWO2_01_44_7]|nr:MAG: polyprenyl synthetase [Deltaproteobacteria bacterium RIFCSPHIGHO2_01_FULL_43_49]OGQ14576.1 MAG: polyprenyl synthetase [Deltaproteobacteria bacterium RIFCSPHIGHO2_02_FULL_44_53]OGQ27962.1 MAG: polyprenyl synthetase [Deltaproteobacteria bacterium RIFCSPHIGHO2_12_FULL_44_21]OGQ31174.1 MAG: polyprenyl synthetase [Deltaproteobacteria bacterium RIFCSPLOWO2_01_FULL_45_74]OGQ37888.1 MAG: polyprenyl synthetase [Deltaproteobacteria bacterium RIFCSPLOWO2_01_44_7]OGQ43165.1 MAG: polyprenyl synthet